MKKRPIRFSAPEVRAILAGTKTQTRRLLKPQPTLMQQGWLWVSKKLLAGHAHTDSDALARLMLPHCPFGASGDRLWVREAFMPAPLDAEPDADGRSRWNIAYGAGGQMEIQAPAGYNPMLYNYERWTPSIHMPRWASRITLEITGIRVERLQDISEADAIAEGIPHHDVSPPDMCRFTFRQLWESINGPGSWDANPWVWVVEFEKAVEGKE